MSVRDNLLSGLSKEILGPRDGINEVIHPNSQGDPIDPAKEYVTGILEPSEHRYPSNNSVFFNDPNIKNPDFDLHDDNDEDDSGIRPEVQTSLDPRSYPKSLGISFLLPRKDKVTISICVSWARYQYQLKSKSWERHPNYYIIKDCNVLKDNEWESLNDKEIKIHLRHSIVKDGIYCSVFLVNETKSDLYKKQSDETSSKIPTEDLVFQPQIRIACGEECKLLPIQDLMTGREENAFALLYRNHSILSRGHFCGTVWKEIDPEILSVEDQRMFGHPFRWMDGGLLKADELGVFSAPDTRTEYIPIFGLEQPSLDAINYDRKPILRAEILAEIWESSQLADALKPLVENYSEWIKNTESRINQLNDRHRSIALSNIEKCKFALKRIENGITLLQSSDDARLAFCFMNMAMYKQSIWKDKSRPLMWRPFQLAFILQCLPSIACEDHSERDICDLLWFSTGAGKTEAYLGLAIFTIALRRLNALKKRSTVEGVSVISRYTLRLLTIQQFRRTLNVITACEYLRNISWTPSAVKAKANYWGDMRFSIGLWVGGGVTPNNLEDSQGYDKIRKRDVVYLGATGELRGRRSFEGTYIKTFEESEPAQVVHCPACHSLLAISPTTLTSGTHKIHWIVYSNHNLDRKELATIKHYHGIDLIEYSIKRLNLNYFTITVTFKIKINKHQHTDLSDTFDSWWFKIIKPEIDDNCIEQFVRPSRPGYFFHFSGISQKPIDFEIRCPSPSCDLNSITWSEKVSVIPKRRYSYVPPAFLKEGKDGVGNGMPIPAYVVDEQIYERCPSVIISTVDKFARLAFEPRASSIFGNVDSYNTTYGFYRKDAKTERDLKDGETYDIEPLHGPDLVIQDELHLLEGPLGTMVGLYETGLEILMSKGAGAKTIRPKYIASTATIKQADTQIRSLFNRTTSQFPPSGLDIEDNFFATNDDTKYKIPDSKKPGRLYVGVCCPGKGAQTPIVRMWSLILYHLFNNYKMKGQTSEEIDQYQTLTGYFNSLRELAGTAGLIKADIPSRLRDIALTRGGRVPDIYHIELSSRTKSFEVPGYLDQLSKFPDNEVDALFATSMFGTGVDVDRLGLMMVNGQPKTTANYIQSTGRVGRKMGGLVITFLRSTKPRDLDHYEFFAGYHNSLHKYVEPVTVYPFSSRAIERGLGPLSVAVLRNGLTIDGERISPEWIEDKKKGSIVMGAKTMERRRRSAEVRKLLDVVELRAQSQPTSRRPPEGKVRKELKSWLDKWEDFVLGKENNAVYSENTLIKHASQRVILGDPEHTQKKIDHVFKNAPQSLREVETTVTFEDEG